MVKQGYAKLKGLLEKKYSPDKVDKMLAIQGLSQEKLDPIVYRKRIFENGLLSETIDANANVPTRLAPSKVFHETYKPQEKLYTFVKLYDKIKELYGEKIADRCLTALLDGTLYFHDATQGDLIYCTAVESLHLVMDGRPWSRQKSRPPKHPQTYLGQLVETIFNFSLEQSGACLPYYQQLCFYDDEVKDIPIGELVESYSGSFKPAPWEGWEYKEVSNFYVKEDGQFVKVLKLFRRKYDGKILRIKTKKGSDLCVTEDHKFKSILGLKKASELKEGDAVFRSRKRVKDPYDLDYITSIEEVPYSNEYVYELETETHWYAVDNIITHNCAISDFFIMYAYMWLKEWGISLDKVNQYYKYSWRKQISNQLQSFCYALNNEVRTSGQSPFTNLSLFDSVKLKQFIKDRYMNLFGIETDEEVDELVKFIIWLEDIYMEMLNSEPSMSFPVSSSNITIDDEGNILDQSFLNKFSKYNAESAKYNIYFGTENSNKLALCCRLNFKTDLTKERAQELSMRKGIDSFGNGAFSIGSMRVVTINLPRLALKSGGNFVKFQENLKDTMDLARYVLYTHRQIVHENIGRDMFIVFKYGYLREDNMFSTFGLSGIYEAMQLLGVSDKEDYIETVSKMLDEIENNIQSYVKEDAVFYNTEFVPGESANATLAKLDNVLFDYKPNDLMLYSNQFIPLWVNAPIFDKIEVDAKLVQKLSGGAISHINIGSKLNEKQMKSLIVYCAKQGLEHWAVNPVLSLCEDGHISYGKFNQCPTCGKPIVEYVSRIVGYFVPVSSWNLTRQKEFGERVVYEINT